MRFCFNRVLSGMCMSVAVFAIAGASLVNAQPAVRFPFHSRLSPDSGIGYGTSVAINYDGTVIAVGQPGYQHNGRVFVYTLQGDSFILSGTYNGVPNVSQQTRSTDSAGVGQSIAMSQGGDMILSGYPVLYMRSGGAQLLTGGPGAGTQNNLVIGGYYNGAARQGTAAAFSQGGSAFALSGPGDSSGAGAIWVWWGNPPQSATPRKWRDTAWASGNFSRGTSLALLGSAGGYKLLIGDPQSDGGKGAIWYWRMFRRGSSKLQDASAPAGSRMGVSVSVSYDEGTVAVGGDGAAWAYSLQGDQFTQIGTRLIGGTSFGASTAISRGGAFLFTGEPAYSGRLGKVHVWQRQGDGFLRDDDLVAVGATDTARFGSAMALSGNGNILVVSGPNDRGKGAVWVYRYNPPPANALVSLFPPGAQPTPAPVNSDWSRGYYKGACPTTQEAVGLSSSFKAPGSSRYATNTLYCGAGANPEGDTTAMTCRNVPFPGNASAGGGANWDPGYATGNCADNELVMGVSQATNGLFQSILCCSSASRPHPHSNPNPVTFSASPPPYGNSEPGAGTFPQDLGNFPLVCGKGRYIIGVSHASWETGKRATPWLSGNLHGIRCAGAPLP